MMGKLVCQSRFAKLKRSFTEKRETGMVVVCFHLFCLALVRTHGPGPSFLDHGCLSLKPWISKNLDVLGDQVLKKWGCDLPFLFKVLSVEKALREIVLCSDR